ncbi:MAG: hypothetical protein ACYS8X_05175 [Planctomycetota bacterium]|jgi:hypothetical protein
MAFAFFRKRQKTVIFIMVVLMVSFLVGPTALNRLFRFRSGRGGGGRMRDGRVVKTKHFQQAYNDLQLLSMATEPSMPIKMSLPEVYLLNRGAVPPRLAYAVLQREAESVGMVAEADIDGFIRSRGFTEETYETFIYKIRSRNIPEEQFRQAVGRLIKVVRAFSRARVDTPPSEPQVRRMFADLTEEIQLRLVKLPAEAFMDQVPEPGEEEVNAQFTDFRKTAAGKVVSADSYGFGYKRPNRVRVQYLLVREDTVARAVQVTRQAMLDYYNAHSGDDNFFQQIGLTDEEAAKLDPTTMKFSDVRDAIGRALKRQAVSEGLDRIGRRITALLQGIDTDAEVPYRQVVDRMTLSADSVLQRRIDALRMEDKTIDEAMASLAEAAGLGAIVFPYGREGDRQVDPSTTLSLRVDNVTLAEALAAICRKVGWPELTWVRCETFEGAGDTLFADGPVGSLPLAARQTPLVGIGGLMMDPVLRWAATTGANPVPLVARAFREERFDKNARDVADDYEPQMVLRTQPGGRLIWRVVEAVPEEVPDLPIPDDIRPQVVRDIKTVKAMELAAAAAEKLLTGDAETLAKRAESAGFVSAEPGPLTRKTPTMAGPAPSPVPGLRFASMQTRQRFFDAAFGLTRHTPTPEQPKAATAISLPADRLVCVVQLLSHKLPSGADYQRQGRWEMLWLMGQLRSARDMQMWYAWDAIEKRTGFKGPERKKREKDPEDPQSP